MTYYNDNDPVLIEWLDALIRDGHLPNGVLDGRSIAHVQGDDLRNFQHVHLFAGIGGWPHAIRLAGWPATRPVWTGSCPCQPFSQAGKQKGKEDSRHLWPEMFRLIEECRPPEIFGEQVASKLGREWLAGVFADLEGLGYAVAGADLCAAGVGAPHIRQRLFWAASLADSIGQGSQGRPEQSIRQECASVERGGDACGVGYATKSGNGALPIGGSLGEGETERRQCGFGGSGASSGLAISQESRPSTKGQEECQPRRGECQSGRTDVRLADFWSDFDIVHCRDGKSRRFKSEAFPLAPRVSGRVAQLRGLGNAVVPQIAAAFVRAFLETEQ